MDSETNTIGSSKLGFFSKPILIKEGHHKGLVMKSYKFIKERSICNELLNVHSSYIPQLEAAGVKIPKTEAEIIEHHNKFSIRIYQKAFPAETMAREMMQNGDLKDCTNVLQGVLDGAITVLNYLQANPEINMGFHPTLRNYAIQGDEFWYFDTFPPMANLSQGELEWFILHFAPYSIPNWFKKIAKPFMNKVTDEYYHSDKMFLGIVGSSCRLRPEFTDQFLSMAKEKVHELNNVSDKNIISSKLDNPPNLPLIWTLVRKILGKEGKANTTK